MKHLFLLTILMLPVLIFAAYLQDLPTEVTDPDGNTLHLFASGDEYANRLHDANGFTIMQSPTNGYYYYAVLQDNEPVPSSHRVGTSDPVALGLQPNINISRTAYNRKVQQMQVPRRFADRGPNTGTVNNINVFIRFSDQTEFEDSRATYDLKFNPVEDDAYSLRNYFRKVSYDQLDYVTHHYPVCASDVNLSYQDSHPRNYYVPYNAITNPIGYDGSDERAYREQTMLANAIAFIANQVPASLNIDADDDGAVDNVCFIIRGPHTAWADLLWAHRWALYYVNAFIHDKQVWDFTFQPENHNNVRVLCHEMFHSVGAPDLYHYTFNGITPTGPWDIMESGIGHMGMYMKRKYGGWIPQIQTISTPGVYSLNPVTSQTNNVYRINGTSSQEYFVIEYRKRGSDIFEQGIPGSGLLIYRIRNNLDGNADGPPDEVYVYRPNGNNNSNGQIADATFSSDVFRTEFNNYTNPRCFYTNGNLAGISIHSIGESAETISFTLSNSSSPYPPVITNFTPANGSILTPGDITVSFQIDDQTQTLNPTSLWLDDIHIGTDANLLAGQTFYGTIPADLLTPGFHNIRIQTSNSNGFDLVRQNSIRIVNPQVPNWFSWITPEPVWEAYGRGAVPIQAAVIYDLGDQDYNVNKLRFYLSDNPWGDPATPGLINAKINRFASGAITEQTLLNIGNINCTLDEWFELDITDETILNGKIAVILDLYEYQSIMFDVLSPCGFSWLTEPNRPWTDALGRGILGSAAIELELQSPYVANDDEVIPPTLASLISYPNPFNPETTINYTIHSPGRTRLSVYNLKGQLINTLFDGFQDKGMHSINFTARDKNGKSLSSGIYLLKLDIPSGQSVYRKILLSK